MFVFFNLICIYENIDQVTKVVSDLEMSEEI